MKTATKKLYRSTEDYIVAGVCAGLGEYFDMDPVIFRILFIILALSNGIGILIYLILIVIVPKKDKGGYSDKVRKEKAKNFANDLKTGIRNISKEMKIEKKTLNSKKEHGDLVAVLLIIFGFTLFFNQIFPIYWFRWDLFWPLTMIFIGFWILFKKN